MQRVQTNSPQSSRQTQLRAPRGPRRAGPHWGGPPFTVLSPRPFHSLRRRVPSPHRCRVLYLVPRGSSDAHSVREEHPA